MTVFKTILSSCAIWFVMVVAVIAQQLPDMEFHFANPAPAFAKSSGPVVRVDAGHSPYVRNNSFEPFVKLLGEDGFRADYIETKITPQALADVQILVIVNAFKKDYSDYSVMQPPSAYDENEIKTIVEWVQNGGRLLLIADHAPLSGGTIELAEKFGFTFFNAHVLKKSELPKLRGRIDYRVGSGLNRKSPIFDKKFAAAAVEHYYIFTGSAFIAPDEAVSVLNIPADYVAIFTNSIRREVDSAAQIEVSGLSQGATMQFGKGRLAVFAEAGSFSAQVVNGYRKMGMNNPVADQNPAFVLGTLEWLAEGL